MEKTIVYFCKQCDKKFSCVTVKDGQSIKDDDAILLNCKECPYDDCLARTRATESSNNGCCGMACDIHNSNWFIPELPPEDDDKTVNDFPINAGLFE